MERVLSVPGTARALALLAGALLAGGASAEDDASAAWLLGDWGGTRSALAAHGLDMEFVATTDFMAVAHGGRSRGLETPTSLGMVFKLDTGTAGWWKNGSLRLHLLGTFGGDPSRRVGDMQITSNVEAPDTVKVFGASYEQRFLDDRLGVLVGLHDLNEDFYVTEHSGMFLNSSFGIGIDIAQVGPSTFPATAPGIRLRLNWTPNTYLLAAVYDGVPGDPNNPYGTHIEFNQGDGVFAIAEAGLLGGKENYYKLGVGGWHRTTHFNDLDGVAQDTDSGIYAIGETDLWRNDDGRGVGAFTQLGFADGDNHQVETYVGAGLTWTGPLAARPADVAGFAVAHARNGDHFRQLNPGTERAETTLELSYLVAPAPWLTIQPDIQYVINPSTDRAINDALVVALRVQVAL